MGHKKADSQYKFMSRRKIYDRNDLSQVYLERLTIFACPLFSLKYHVIHLSDAVDDLHSHPWSFLRTLILKGSYREDTPEGSIYRPRGSTRKMTRTDLHRVEVLEGPVHTLALTGRHRPDDWGFQVDGQMVPFEESLGDDQETMM